MQGPSRNTGHDHDQDVPSPLRVGAVDAPAEASAHHVAHETVRRLASDAAGAPGAPSGHQAHDAPARPVPLPARGAATSGAAGRAGGDVEPALAARIAASRGRALDAPVRRRFESAMGSSLGDVRIHQDSPHAAALGAVAFTQGSDVHLSPGAYAPGSPGGDHVLAHELAHVVSERAGAEGDAPVVRRLVGFEIETGIPLWKKVTTITGDEWHQTYPSDIADRVPITRGKISVDHIDGHAPSPTEPGDKYGVVELVTDPIDDNLSLDDFDRLAQASWLDELVRIKRLANAPTAPYQLGGAYWVGLPTPRAYGQWDRIAPQVTAGVKLDQVGRLLAQFSLDGRKGASIATQLGRGAGPIAAAIVADLYDLVAPVPGQDKANDDLAAGAAMRGLLTLMADYLLVGAHLDVAAGSSYLKNRPANIMVKTKLSTVRTKLVTQYRYAATWLNDGLNRTILADALLEKTGRRAGDPLFVASADGRNGASTVTAGEWVEEVLDGTGDQAFDEMKNAWATEIDSAGPDEAVIELRKPFVKSGDMALENGNLLTYLRQCYAANKLLKAGQL